MTWLIGLILKYALPSVLGDLSSDIVTELGALLQTEITRRQTLAEGADAQAARETAITARTEASVAQAEASSPTTTQGVQDVLKKGAF